MKWKEVKLLCAGMGVCTILATGGAVIKNVIVKPAAEGAIVGSWKTENDMTELARTEMMPEAEVERHEVFEVGNGIIEGAEAGGYVLERPESDLIIADVTNYVNIRSIPGADGEIVGKLYDDSVGTFIAEENGWYQISSGTVTGYVKAEYCVTGEEAVTLAREVGTRFATVTTQTLFVRMEPTTESSVLAMIPVGEDFVVMEETDTWAKITLEEGEGWVSKEYVEIRTEFVEAESKEEEEARLEKEAEERRRAQAAALASQQAAQQTTQQNNTSQGNTNYTVGEGSELGVAVAEYALQFVGNPYKWGGTSLTNGADCSGFVMSVYANFGVSLPHSSKADRTQGYAVDGLENAQPGDLICYSGHVAIYIGNGQIVHEANAKKGIIVSNADYKKILAIRRIF